MTSLSYVPIERALVGLQAADQESGNRVAKSTDVRTTTLYRPVGPQELELIKALEFGAFPPRLLEQPIFYPVLTEGYAIQIARDWNGRAPDGAGFVTRFSVDSDYLDRFDVQRVGSGLHLEYWIPAEELVEFNSHIVGRIEVIHSFRSGR